MNKNISSVARGLALIRAAVDLMPFADMTLEHVENVMYKKKCREFNSSYMFILFEKKILADYSTARR